MVALIIGLLLVGFTVYSLLPAGLNWGLDVLTFLKPLLLQLLSVWFLSLSGLQI